MSSLESNSSGQCDVTENLRYSDVLKRVNGRRTAVLKLLEFQGFNVAVDNDDSEVPVGFSEATEKADRIIFSLGEYLNKVLYLDESDIGDKELSYLAVSGDIRDYVRLKANLTEELTSLLVDIIGNIEGMQPIYFNMLYLQEGGEDLLKKSIENYLKSDDAKTRWGTDSDLCLAIGEDGINFAVKETMKDIVNNPNAKVGFQHNVHLESIVQAFLANELGRRKKDKFEVINKDRDEAALEIQNLQKQIHGLSLPECWEDSNTLELSDEQMTGLYRVMKDGNRGDNRLLSTYFNSSFFGLKNVFIAYMVDKISETFAYESRSQVIRVLLHEFGPKMPDEDDKNQSLETYLYEGIEERPDKKFSPPVPKGFNILFADRGTAAAHLLFDNCIQEKGKVVLTTDQEYGDILEHLETECGAVVKSIDRSDSEGERIESKYNHKEEDKYLLDIERAIEEKNPDYFLISHTSRLGPNFPLKRISDLIVKMKKRGYGVKLVIDSCQSLGRNQMDYSRQGIVYDAMFTSCQKGYEVGREAGFLIVKDDLLNVDKIRRSGSEFGNGTKTNLAYIAIASRPEYWMEVLNLKNNIPPEISAIKKGITPEIIEKMFAGSDKRRKALVNISYKFITLLKDIKAYSEGNKSRKGKRKFEFGVEVLNPEGMSDFLQSEGNLSANNIGKALPEEAMSHTYELKLRPYNKLIDFEEVSNNYGVLAGIISDGSDRDGSLRVSFHPFMGDRAIRLLGYVLMICSDPDMMIKSRYWKTKAELISRDIIAKHNIRNEDDKKRILEAVLEGYCEFEAFIEDVIQPECGLMRLKRCEGDSKHIVLNEFPSS